MNIEAPNEMFDDESRENKMKRALAEFHFLSFFMQMKRVNIIEYRNCDVQTKKKKKKTNHWAVDKESNFITLLQSDYAKSLGRYGLKQAARVQSICEPESNR